MMAYHLPKSTRDALRFTLTFCTPRNTDAFFSHLNIVELAKNAGFKTHWISNQGDKYLHDSYTSMIGKCSDFFDFNVGIRERNDARDINLLEPFKDTIEKGENQFIVLHLNGSHQLYSDHYGVEDKDAIDKQSSPKYFNYDRTIHHTDRFIRELNRIINGLNEEAILYYYSDHGEKINRGHSILNGPPILYEIPIIAIGYNNSVDINSIVSKYIIKEYQELNSLSNILILSELMGYSLSDSFLRKRLEDNNFIYEIDGTVHTIKDRLKK